MGMVQKVRRGQSSGGRSIAWRRLAAGLVGYLAVGCGSPAFAATDNHSKPTSKLQARGKLVGQVKLAGTGRAAAGIEVIVADAGDLAPGPVHISAISPQLAWTRSVVTNERGEFEVDKLPLGNVLLMIATPTTLRHLEVVVVEKGDTKLPRIFLAPDLQAVYRTVSRIERRIDPTLGRQVLDAEQMRTMPGSLSDPVRALENFPGIARGQFGKSELRIRGAAPGDSAMMLGEHAVPLMVHFGAVKAIVPTQALATIEYHPGNFSARYGNAIGGVARGVPAKGRTDRLHAQLTADLLDAGAIVDGPLGRGSYFVAARRSYVDRIVKRLEGQLESLAPHAIPVYYDYQVYFDHPLGTRSDLSVHVIGASDQGDVFFLDELSTGVSRNAPRDRFVRADFEIRSRAAKWRILTSGAYGLHLKTTDSSSSNWERSVHLISWRHEVERALTSRLELQAGIESKVAVYDEHSKSKSGVANDLESSLDWTNVIAAAYISATWHPLPKFEVMLSSRISAFQMGLGKHLEGLSEPRIGAALRVLPRLKLRASSGIYAQARDASFQLGQDQPAKLGLARSLHSSVGALWSRKKGIEVQLNLFHKHLWHLSVSRNLALAYPRQSETGALSNRGIGRVMGAELSGHYEVTPRFRAWLAYTLMQSKRNRYEGGRLQLDEFDQRHLLTAVIAGRLPYGWSLGLRFRMASGNLYTPTRGSVSSIGSTLSDNFRYDPISGEPLSARTPAFRQLDARVDKTMVFRYLKLIFSLDLLNATNTENIEGYIEGYDKQLNVPIYSLSIVPAFGLRAEY